MIYTQPDERSQLLKGEVIASGPRASVAPGAHILFTQACKQPNADGTMWIRDSDLVGVIEAEAKVIHGDSPFYSEVKGRS